MYQTEQKYEKEKESQQSLKDELKAAKAQLEEERTARQNKSQSNMYVAEILGKATQLLDEKVCGGDDTIQYNATQRNATQYNSIQCNTMLNVCKNIQIGNEKCILKGYCWVKQTLSIIMSTFVTSVDT